MKELIVDNAKIHIDGTRTHIHAKMDDQDDIPNVRGVVNQLAPGYSWDYGYLVYSLPNGITVYLK